MLEITVNAQGKNFGDLEEALLEATRQVSEGYQEGFNGNEGGSYHFEVTGQEEGFEAAEDIEIEDIYDTDELEATWA